MAPDGGLTSLIRVVWGAATGPTAVASYDAALAEANVHEYNLAHVSSIVPAGATVEPVGTAPDLGPTGGRLWVVEARMTIDDPGQATAALGWATGETGGVFYEFGGTVDEETAREEISAGLAAARELRDRSLPDELVESVTIEAPRGTSATALVLAVFGEAEPLLHPTHPE